MAGPENCVGPLKGGGEVLVGFVPLDVCVRRERHFCDGHKFRSKKFCVERVGAVVTNEDGGSKNKKRVHGPAWGLGLRQYLAPADPCAVVVAPVPML